MHSMVVAVAVGSVNFYGKAMKTLLSLVAIALALLFSPVGVAHAKDNDVNVAVCTGSEGSTITITQPISDSVINQPVTTFRGAVTNATQIEIEIDGVYASSVPIGSNQATYVTDITLTSGTHTIKLIANDVCQHSNDSASVVLTYEPETGISNGGITPTDVQGGVVIGSDQGSTSQDPVPFQLENFPVVGTVYKALIDFGRLIGVDATLDAGASNTVIGVMRVGFTLLALTLLIIPSTFFPVATKYAPAKLATIVKAEMRRNRHYLDRIFRGLGGLLLLLIYFS